MSWGRDAPAGGWWQQLTHENTNFQAPGHERMFGGPDVDHGDPTGRAFTTRKRHGWWGKEERFDLQGRKLD